MEFELDASCSGTNAGSLGARLRLARQIRSPLPHEAAAEARLELRLTDGDRCLEVQSSDARLQALVAESVERAARAAEEGGFEHEVASVEELPGGRWWQLQLRDTRQPERREAVLLDADQLAALVDRLGLERPRSGHALAAEVAGRRFVSALPGAADALSHLARLDHEPPPSFGDLLQRLATSLADGRPPLWLHELERRVRLEFLARLFKAHGRECRPRRTKLAKLAELVRLASGGRASISLFEQAPQEQGPRAILLRVEPSGLVLALAPRCVCMVEPIRFENLLARGLAVPGNLSPARSSRRGSSSAGNSLDRTRHRSHRSSGRHAEHHCSHRGSPPKPLQMQNASI